VDYNPAVTVRALLRISVAFAVVTYLCAAGWFFVLAPWSPFWMSRVVAASPPWLTVWLKAAALRGALSGFGVLHFPAAFAWLASGARKA